MQNTSATVADLGLTRKAIHEARQVRDAEAADPGVVRRTVDAAVEERREPTLDGRTSHDIQCLQAMSPNRLASFRLDETLLDGLRAVTERDGIPQTEQVRRALRAWLEERGVLSTPAKAKTARKRVQPRKQA